jgi:hypothetical protein
MLTSAPKRYILSFLAPKSSAPEVEAAAVFAVTEFERSKGGGLVFKQPPESLLFIAKVGYPLWLFPRNDTMFIFDGLSDSSYSVAYAEGRSAKVFMENLNKNLVPRENYMIFLSEHNKYFQEPAKQKEFNIPGLIANLEFKEEFRAYRKEALEANDQALANLGLLFPILEESTISSMLAELDKQQTVLKEDAAKLNECFRLVSKTTSQHVTEIDYESQAVKEEADAKIRALEEFIDPQTAKLNSDYRRKTKSVAESYDREIENLQKIKAKTEKDIEINETKIREYDREAKYQAAKNHKIYEKRWKEKRKKAQKEVSAFRNKLKKIEKNIKNMNKQKSEKISQLNFELNREIRLAREPVVQLEINRNSKMQVLRHETEKLLKLEKPVIEGIHGSIRLREESVGDFDRLGTRGQQLKSPALFYISFYAACYEAGLARRYLVLPPSTVGRLKFSAKLKGALGMSKTRNLLTPRFKTMAALVRKVQTFTQQNSVFESQLATLMEKNNLSKNSLYLENVRRGLICLKYEGWLSESEQQFLSDRAVA